MQCLKCIWGYISDASYISFKSYTGGAVTQTLSGKLSYKNYWVYVAYLISNIYYDGASTTFVVYADFETFVTIIFRLPQF